jgi:hypothetical protein
MLQIVTFVRLKNASEIADIAMYFFRTIDKSFLNGLEHDLLDY